MPAPTSAAVASTQDAENRAHALGMALMISGALIIPLIDLFAKALGQGYFGAERAAPLWVVGEPLSGWQVAWGRFLMQVVLLAPFVLLMSPQRFRPPVRFGLVMLRGVAFALSSVAFFAALPLLDLADTAAIFFVEPLILTVMSAIFLGERIGWRRVSAVCVGLVGAMLIIQPNFATAGWAALLPLLAALFFAIYLLLTRMLAQSESPLTLQLWSGIVGLAILSLLHGVGVIAGVEELTPAPMAERHWMIFVAIGVVATIGHLLLSAAFRYAEASALAPLQYFEIIGAAALGYWFFGEKLGQETAMGLALIIGSGVFVLRRERRLQQEAPLHHPVAPPARD